jgi:hypothetical protein
MSWGTLTTESTDEGGRISVSSGRLLKIKHDHRDIGFLSARVVTDEWCKTAWTLRVESPADIDEFRTHLADGACMTLTMVSRGGDHFRGEACVSSVSDSVDTVSVVTLAGMGPLQSV